MYFDYQLGQFDCCYEECGDGQDGGVLSWCVVLGQQQSDGQIECVGGSSMIVEIGEIE